jgi:hypothetical protein
VLDRVNRRDRFSMKKPLRSSARGASFHTKHASNTNIVGVVLLLDANSYLTYRSFLNDLNLCNILQNLTVMEILNFNSFILVLL